MNLFSYILLLAPASAWTPDWQDGGSGNSKLTQYCHKHVNVFGITVCVTKKSWEASSAKADHVANVVAQYIDNDEDGVADDTALPAQFASTNSILIYHNKDSDRFTSRELAFINHGALASCDYTSTQNLFQTEVITNSCAVPENRGAVSSDRSTWQDKFSSTTDANGNTCDTTFDATIEEVLHLVNSAGTDVLYNSIWGAATESTVGGYLDTLKGDCGNGYSGDYKDPTLTPETCSYSYDDGTCDASCIVIEGIYWSLTTYLGAQYYSGSRAPGEFLVNTPDTGMSIQTPGEGTWPTLSSWGTMQDKAADLYTLVSDRGPSSSKWLPTKTPDGSYGNTPQIVEPSCPDLGVTNVWTALRNLFIWPTPWGLFAGVFVNLKYFFIPF